MSPNGNTAAAVTAAVWPAVETNLQFQIHFLIRPCEQIMRAHDLWIPADKALFKKVTRRINEQQEANDITAKHNTFSLWLEQTIEKRKKKAEIDQRERFQSILRNSTRGQRSTMEKEEIRRFISKEMTCIPKSISFSEMDTLCNEVDWIPYIGRSILFLQGDFGNVYYMIARGRVGLYLEPSKDREMVIAREFGKLRAQPYHGTDEELNALGNNIINLPKGAGFGEFAILATTNKIRSCACVSLDDDSMLLIMHADTYNTVLRQHHYRQKQLSSATALLQQLPLFRGLNYSKVASVAYTMRSQTYSNQSLIVGYGDTITSVFLIAAGQVKVYSAPSIDEKDGHNKALQKRIPKLAIALLGKGQIIGEMEVQKGLTTFQMTYEASGSSTEVLGMPAAIFKDTISSGGLTQSMLYKNIEEMNDAKEQRRMGRMNRAYDAMKNMMVTEVKGLQSKDQLVRVLPVLLDPPPLTAADLSGASKHADKNSGPKRHAAGSYFGDERPAVTRKSSYAVQVTEDGRTVPATAASSIPSPFGSGTASLRFGSADASAGGPNQQVISTRESIRAAIEKSVVTSQSPRRETVAAKVDFVSAPVSTKPAAFNKTAMSPGAARASVLNRSTGGVSVTSPSGSRPSALSNSPRFSILSPKHTTV